MTQLIDYIFGLIDKAGPLAMADYMRLALQHPDYGYYRSGDPLGRAGDFITSPEISQMFGEMIGLWAADTWRQMGAPDRFALLEMGPGRGTLMADALRATAKIPGFHRALQLYLLESSTTLRQAQLAKLAAYRPVYIDALDQLPSQPLIALSNEFFDALPIHQFEQTFTGWLERCVGLHNGELVFVLQPPEAACARMIPPALKDAKPGAVYEVSPDSLIIMRQLAQHIARFGGAALTVDYGYTEPDYKPTLQAVAAHKSVNVLSDPGKVDLTAHVDFGALKQVALHQTGLQAFGPIGQGEFLKNLGIELRAGQLKARATPKQMTTIDSALHRLTDPSQMGSLFKVLALAAAPLNDLPGF